MTLDKQINYDSPESAAYKTDICGWVSRNGHFWGKDEHMARYDGCTHLKCKCGKYFPKEGYMICPECRVIHDQETYSSFPKEKWDDKAPIATFGGGEYFWSREDLDEYLEDNNLKVEDLQLVFCKPLLLPQFDAYDLLYDYLPDDDREVPNDIEDAVSALNEVLLKHKQLSWYPGKVAVIVE